MDLQTLERDIVARRRELDTRWGEARQTLLRGKELKREVTELTELVQTYDKVTGLLNSIAEDQQQAAQHNIEDLVTSGLQTIFDASLSFHILQSTKGKSASVEFVVRTALSNGQAVDTPVMDARGGGLAATIGFLLRVVVILLRRQETLLVLDETFAMVSREYLSSLGQFLRQLVDKTNLQILMVTHQDELVEFADRVYRFRQEDGRTKVVAE